MPDTLEESKDTLRDARVADFAGRDAVFFNAGLHWSHRRFVMPTRC